jgi:hypothetical protein
MQSYQWHPQWEFGSDDAKYYVFSEGVSKEVRVQLLFSRRKSANQPGSSQRELRIVKSSCLKHYVIGTRKEFLQDIFDLWRISPTFQIKFWGHYRSAVFDYSLEPSKQHENYDSAQRLDHINIEFFWTANEESFFRAFGRYHVPSSSLNVFITWNSDLQNVELPKSLNDYANELKEDHLAFFGILLQYCYRHLQESHIKLHRRVWETEYSLGISANLKNLEKKGFKKSGRSLEEENKHLYTLHQSVALDILSCNQLISICNQYTSAATTIEKSYQHQIPLDLVQTTVNDTEILAQMFAYLEKMVQTQFTVLYNRIIQEDTKHTIEISESSRTIAVESKKDSSSMKTVAYLTLTFLPVTSVSAVFSTTLFNFQN